MIKSQPDTQIDYVHQYCYSRTISASLTLTHDDFFIRVRGGYVGLNLIIADELSAGENNDRDRCCHCAVIRQQGGNIPRALSILHLQLVITAPCDIDSFCQSFEDVEGRIRVKR